MATMCSCFNAMHMPIIVPLWKGLDLSLLQSSPINGIVNTNEIPTVSRSTESQVQSSEISLWGSLLS